MKKEKKITSKKSGKDENSEIYANQNYPSIGTSFVTIISSALVSLVVGAIGCLLVVPYFINPQAGSDVVVSDYNWGNNNLVIRDPKKVVVNQDVKVEESINSVAASMLKFYPKLKSSSTENVISNLDNGNYYLLKEPFSSGVALSADGWVLALWPNEKSIDLKKIAADFQALSVDGKIYNIDRVLLVRKSVNNQDKEDFAPILIHLSSVNSLPVRSLAKAADLKIGQALFSFDGGRNFDFGFLVDRKKSTIIRSSEDSTESLILDLGLNSASKPNFVFNLAGDLLGWQISPGKVFPVYTLNARLNSLFKSGKMLEPFFGVTYYNLVDLKIPNFNQENGALIYSNEKENAIVAGSPAEKAGLKKGDLILGINGEILSGANDLSAIIQNYLPGQELLISYSRSGVNTETSLRLGELK